MSRVTASPITLGVIPTFRHTVSDYFENEHGLVLTADLLNHSVRRSQTAMYTLKGSTRLLQAVIERGRKVAPVLFAEYVRVEEEAA